MSRKAVLTELKKGMVDTKLNIHLFFSIMYTRTACQVEAKEGETLQLAPSN